MQTGVGIVQWVSGLLNRLRHEQDGQAMVEYALIIALVAIVVILALVFLGHGIFNAVNNVANALNNAAG